jgi:outer membrane protein OmpA-like peptidoglycan-associated protein
MRENKVYCLFLVLYLSFVCYGSVIETPNITKSGQVGLIDCYSANTLGETRLLFSVSGSFAYDTHLNSQLIIHDGLFEKTLLDPSSVLYGLYPVVGYGITDFLDVSLTQPFYFDIVVEEGIPTGGNGDLQLSAKCRIPGTKPRMFDGALLTELTIPSGNKQNGFFPRHRFYLENKSETNGNVPSVNNKVQPRAFYSATNPRLALVALGTFKKKFFSVHANAGVNLAFSKESESAFLGALGMEIDPSEWFSFFTDLYLEPRFSNVIDDFTISEDIIHFSPGITFHAPNGAVLTLGTSFKISSNKEFSYHDHTGHYTFSSRTEPQWQLFLQLGWNGFLIARDKDNDMLRDKFDSCPDKAEDIDGFEDDDGCPDEDNDNDSIPDTTDKCANIPEDRDGFLDDDGCPEYDNDEDMIADSVDNCPTEAEDRDGYQDEDGCPDPDNDNDSVPDTLDKCMGVSEDRDGFEDDDGCPDLDNDKDGVADSIDNCPDVAGINEEDGCPQKAKEIKRGRVILPGVQFGGGSNAINSDAAETLDRVYQSLNDWPEVKLEIQAHTDNSAPPKKSLRLSEKRAQAVREYLINKGIDESRLTAIGKGSGEPIADNKSVHGRKINNRIEIHRID